MRRTALYVAAWFAAGVGAVVLATAGVSMVGNQVTGSRPSPLSADEVRSELAAESTTTTAPGATTTTAAPGAVTTTTAAPPSGSTPTSQPPGGAPTTTAPTVVAVAPPETRTYALVGGTATLRFTPSGVDVVVANPNAGFSVEIEPTHDNGIRVEFRNDDHRSRVEGWWDDGPRDDVEEDGGDG